MLLSAADIMLTSIAFAAALDAVVRQNELLQMLGLPLRLTLCYWLLAMHYWSRSKKGWDPLLSSIEQPLIGRAESVGGQYE